MIRKANEAVQKALEPKATALDTPVQLVLSVNDAASYLCVGRNTIYNLIKNGRLTKFETGFRRRLIRRHELDEIIAGTR